MSGVLWPQEFLELKKLGYVAGVLLDFLFSYSTLPETNIAPENGWLEDDRFLLGWPIFRCFGC